MKYRKFGRLGWNVSEIGYGMWGMGAWTGSDDAESLASLQRAIKLGINFFDTAWAYGAGHSESLLGQAVRAQPVKKLYTATKIPPRNRKWPALHTFSLDDCYPPDYIEEFVHASLKNLGLPRLDLMQFHTWDDGWTKDDRWYKKMDALRSQGLIGAIGLSLNRWEPENGVLAVRSGLVDAVQVIYNIFDQNPEDELFPVCREKHVAVIARCPFDEGTLTGTLTLESKWPEGDWRNGYFVPENLKSSVEHAEPLKKLVPPGSSMSEMALRFILTNPDVCTIIPGMRKLRHVENNAAVSDKGPLTPALQQELRRHRWVRRPTHWSQ
jgi:aryl-alcohol dehydrogenase-like predicted oxidoreductase